MVYVVGLFVSWAADSSEKRWDLCGQEVVAAWIPDRIWPRFE